MAEGMTLKKEGVRDGEKEGQKKSCCSKLPFSSFPLSGDPAKSIRLTLHIKASTRAVLHLNLLTKTSNINHRLVLKYRINCFSSNPILFNHIYSSEAEWSLARRVSEFLRMRL